jgi:hypothetical protein
MAYYPQSQIKTDLYTNGEEFQILTSSQPYKGFYYILSNGKKYTGKNPEDGPNQELTVISTNPENVDGLLPPNQIVILDVPYENTPYVKESIDQYRPSSLSTNRSLPTPIQTLPTQKDKDLGSFPRYFCKKTNENYYIEINKEQFTKLQSRDITIAWDLYIPLQIIWQIKGGKTKTYNANKNNITLIEQRNKWYGFTKYFKDRFLKYYLES